MKPYLEAKNKIAKLFEIIPNGNNYSELSWINFVKEIINKTPNSAAKLISNRCPNLIYWLSIKFPDTESNGEKLFRYINVADNRPGCIICNSDVKFNGITSGYKKYCSLKCKGADPKTKEKIKATCMQKFGSASPFSSIECRLKMQNTNIKKYGSANVYASDAIKAKIKNTNITRYGVENAAQSSKIKEKIKATCLTKYGADYYFKTEQFRQKYEHTCMQKYGTTNVMQNPDILHRSQINSFKLKPFTLPSGKIILYQGYENVAIQHFLKSVSESDLVFLKEVPTFKYGNNKIYFPDLFVISTNTIVEIKSEWTLSTSEQHDEMSQKSKAVLLAGYNFQLLICSKTSILHIHDGIYDRK